MAIVQRIRVIAGRAPARATAFVFFANGFLFANWVVRIPSVKERLALNEAELGLALLFMAVGAIIAMPVTGALVSRFGSSSLTVVSGVFYCLAFWPVGMASNFPLLALALFVAGAANGAMDVSQNAQADAAERVLGIRIMSFCHAMWSAGLALGSIPAGLFSAAQVGVSVQLALVGGGLAVGVLWAGRALVPDPPVAGSSQALFAIPKGPLLLFGIICLCGTVIEGGMNDWIAVYVQESMGLGPIAAATAYGAFAAAMFSSRLVGDLLNERFGASLVVRVGMLLAAAGIFAATTGVFALTVVGFAAVGLGIAAVFPAVVSAAGRLPGRPPGPSIAAAVTLGYGGFLFGPAAIGFLAQWSSLRLALLALVVLCLTGAALSGALRLSTHQ
ncbi:MAG: MFS transporter [Pseudomonadota bacterium]